MLDALRIVAPGTALRDGIDRILQARMGSLIVVGDSPDVLALCSGGFLLDAEFTPQRLSELAKMDGAIILATDCSRVARANVHLVPDPFIPTSETGTRHRTAERVARQIGVTVVSVSEEMSIVTLYRGNERHSLEPIPRLLARADQALQTLERYRTRLDTVNSSLSALEVEDLVTVRDVVAVLAQTEMVRRIAEEIEWYIVELGTDGRLAHLQLEELMAGVNDDRRLVARDYALTTPEWSLQRVMDELASLTTEELLDLRVVQSVLNLAATNDLDSLSQPRGYRLLHRIPRLPSAVADRVVDHFGSLARVMRSSAEDLTSVDGVGETRARSIKDGLARIAENSILDRYT